VNEPVTRDSSLARRKARFDPRWRAWVWQALATVVLVLSIIMARALLSARGEWEGGQRALAAGHPSLAITYFRRSASWHVPFSPYTARSLEMLDHLAQREGAKGRHEAARVAMLAKKSAQHSARTLASSLPTDPRPWFSVLALAGWLCWCGAALLLVTRGLDEESQLTPQAPRHMVAILLGMAAFALGLALA
jgi:hypothetical protein